MDEVDLQRFIQERRSTGIQKVSCGYLTVTLFNVDQLDDAQIGYSVSDTGEDFSGPNDGDWKSSWLVVGGEDLCGDPIFVDLSTPTLPVFTAAHGQGRWDALLLASSFAGFVVALAEVDRICENRRNPVELQRHPLTEKEKEHVLKNIARATDNTDLSFWEHWLQV